MQKTSNPSTNNPITQDFHRDVYCLLGLPVDNLSMESAKALLYDKAGQKGNVVLSTINVNWVVQSFANTSFRAAILNSDIITLDGRPLLWLAKLLGYPMSEVVSGSTLIQELHRDKTAKKPLTIFLFGGEEGAAGQALERINRNQGGLRAVGALNPGFGTVEQMSSDAIINTINETHPDILLVALGAKKRHSMDRVQPKPTQCKNNKSPRRNHKFSRRHRAASPKAVQKIRFGMGLAYPPGTETFYQVRI